MEALLEVEHLHITFPKEHREIVKDCSFTLKKQEILGIVGESGSGKTTMVMSLPGFLKEGAEVTKGKILYCGQEITPPLRECESQKIRGREIAVIMQNAMTSLDPLMRVGTQIAESVRMHTGYSREETKERVEELLDMVGIRDVKGCMNKYPFECSGGMQQRICIAIALAGNPKILIADEPTTALDVTVQAQILNLLGRLSRDFGISIILVSHDLGVVGALCDRIMIMKEGKIIELGKKADILQGGKEAYTKALIQARKNLERMEGLQKGKEIRPALIQAEEVSKSFQKKEVLHEVSLTIRQNETYGLVGESGCGKSTLAYTLLGIYHADAGSILWKGTCIKKYNQKMQMVFQNPYQALNPSMTIYENLREALVAREITDEKEIHEEVESMLEKVKIDVCRQQDFPLQMSGGQLQRVMIARALLMSPELLVCDEPFTGLDIQVQEQLVLLLNELKEKEQLSMLIIGHDLSLMSRISDMLGVIYAGWMMEEGPCRMVAEDPWHPYTKSLFLAGEKVKLTGTDRKKVFVFEEIGDCKRTAGCPYAENCRYAQRRCFARMPEMYEYGNRRIRCFLYAQEKSEIREKGYHMRSLI